MAINFPNSPVQGNTYDYLGIRYTYQDAGGGLGHWAILTPGTVGIATGAEIDAGADAIKYVTSKGMEDSDYAKSTSPSLTGTPTAPTPGDSDDSTRIATTAFVKALGHIEEYRFTADQTFIIPVNAKGVKFILQGSGGGGGGVEGQGSSTSGSSVGGAAGGAGIVSRFGALLDASYILVVGVGGAVSTPGNFTGNHGTDTSVTGTNLTSTAEGGLGGTGRLASSANLIQGGRAGAACTGADHNMDGGASEAGITVNGEVGSLSNGGDSHLGNGGRASFNATGASGKFGGGGGGCSALDTNTDHSGGAGGDGVIIAYVYF